MPIVSYIAILRAEADGDLVKKQLEKKVPLLTCNYRNDGPIPFLSGNIQSETYKALFKAEPAEDTEPQVPPFLKQSIDFIVFNEMSD